MGLQEEIRKLRTSMLSSGIPMCDFYIDQEVIADKIHTVTTKHRQKASREYFLS